MSLQDLKAALKALGLPVTGKKEELVARLIASDSADAAAPTAVEPAPITAAAASAEPAPAAAAAPEPATKHAKIVFNAVAAVTDVRRLVD